MCMSANVFVCMYAYLCMFLYYLFLVQKLYPPCVCMHGHAYVHGAWMYGSGDARAWVCMRACARMSGRCGRVIIDIMDVMSVRMDVMHGCAQIDINQLHIT